MWHNFIFSVELAQMVDLEVLQGNLFIPVLISCDCFLKGPSYFWVVIFGQFVAATANSVFFGGAPLLSEVWFPNSERATATAIGAAIAPQLGIMIALGMSPIIIHSDLTDSVCNDSIYSSPVEEDDWRDLIYHRLIYYQGGVAAICILVFIGTVLGKCMKWVWQIEFLYRMTSFC